ncbi:bifunctional RNase H/acid phosphatase [Xylanimonas oleitrophica]|uniref:Bifunctional RNase H/acid phosphatase n=1 Tax=Xylanimonas oleitrophica TaxID=2607479 RepID=A0A2W5WSB1_9MICO|nr:bifunctional RNase H/acid phosphatase [Xylanimonas oleitrophica]PZR53722.1 bifunctional RNase H/acid phosphatase [Xylanimonas oleitrophica]
MPGRHLVVEADGGSRGNPGPAGYGALVRDAATGRVLAERAGFLGIATNNVAEYTGLLEGLRAAHALDPDARVEVRMDSKLVVEQMSGRWQIKHDALRRIAQEAGRVLPATHVSYTWVPRAQNADADRLANEAMDTAGDVVRDHPDEPAGETQPGAASSAGAPAPEAAPGRDTHVRPSGALARYDGADALTVVLVRHGQTPLTVVGGYSGGGVPGPSLTTHGRTQAARAADVVHRLTGVWPDLPRPTEIVASPMVRTQETATAISRRLGLPVRTDARLRECEFGEWESLTAPQIEERWPGELGLWHTTGTYVPPGGESYEQVGERVDEALQELLRAGTGRAVVVVGHAAMIRTVLGRAMGAPSSRWSRLRIPPCSLSVLRAWPDGAAEVTAVGYPTGD